MFGAVLGVKVNEEISQIVELQLDRVKRTAKGQDSGLDFDRSPVGHLADVGDRPEFGARELKRRIRMDVESRVAKAMVEGESSEGDDATIAYDATNARSRSHVATRPGARLQQRIRTCAKTLGRASLSDGA